MGNQPLCRSQKTELGQLFLQLLQKKPALAGQCRVGFFVKKQGKENSIQNLLNSYKNRCWILVKIQKKLDMGWQFHPAVIQYRKFHAEIWQKSNGADTFFMRSSAPIFIAEINHVWSILKLHPSISFWDSHGNPCGITCPGTAVAYNVSGQPVF